MKNAKITPAQNKTASIVSQTVKFELPKKQPCSMKDVFGEYSDWSSQKEIDCWIWEGNKIPNMPVLSVIPKDGIVYYRLMTKEEEVVIEDRFIREYVMSNGNYINPYVLSHRLICPEKKYIKSDCGDIAIHPELYQYLKSFWKMNNKFKPDLAVRICSFYVSFWLENFNDELSHENLKAA